MDGTGELFFIFLFLGMIPVLRIRITMQKPCFRTSNVPLAMRVGSALPRRPCKAVNFGSYNPEFPPSTYISLSKAYVLYSSFALFLSMLRRSVVVAVCPGNTCTDVIHRPMSYTVPLMLLARTESEPDRCHTPFLRRKAKPSIRPALNSPSDQLLALTAIFPPLVVHSRHPSEQSFRST